MRPLPDLPAGGDALDSHPDHHRLQKCQAEQSCHRHCSVYASHGGGGLFLPHCIVWTQPGARQPSSVRGRHIHHSMVAKMSGRHDPRIAVVALALMQAARPEVIFFVGRYTWTHGPTHREHRGCRPPLSLLRPAWGFESCARCRAAQLGAPACYVLAVVPSKLS
jgi:hypothetical protein